MKIMKNILILPKLPDELDQSLESLKNNKDMNDAFGKETITVISNLEILKLKNLNKKKILIKQNLLLGGNEIIRLDC